MNESMLSLAKLRKGESFGFNNAGWNLDAYPDTPTLDAGTEITLADLKGPGVINRIHSTMHTLIALKDDVESDRKLWQLSMEERRALAARGIVIEIYYNDHPEPAVRAPLADFFMDGHGGRVEHFSTPFVEKAPESYNCFIPMPFEKSAKVILRNETIFNVMNYSYVEWEKLERWDGELGYFHATWSREAFQLTNETDREFFNVEGRGHLLGRCFSIASDEPLFQDFTFIMEGNNEIRRDGEAKPGVDYLGTEDAFGMAWGWPKRFIGLRNGATFVQHREPSLLTTYNFRCENVLPFNENLNLRIDWKHEFPGNEPYHDNLARRLKAGGCWVDYATTFYWYQQAVGFAHAPLPPVGERIKLVLKPNPRATENIDFKAT